MEWLADPNIWIAFATLTVLELVLGIDNVIFISILAGKLPSDQQKRARFIGLTLALVMRVILLFSLSWVMSLTTPLMSLWGYDLSGRDLILLIGGLFLIGKSTHEIHGSLEGEEGHAVKREYASFGAVIAQIAVLDLVFSLDSVITAIGMVDKIPVMIAAVMVSIIAMMVFAGTISDFVSKHPTIKMLALAFLLMIGFTLVVEGLHLHIPKGYIYAAMAFSVFVEFLNMKLRGRSKKPVNLKDAYHNGESPDIQAS
ncbi:MAG: TerC family protein [Acidobacteria bacterium]|nr:TerC family protein [Acidobacteriota bacterium]